MEGVWSPDGTGGRKGQDKKIIKGTRGASLRVVQGGWEVFCELLESSRAPHRTREVSRSFLETGKVGKVAQGICSEYTEGVLVSSEIMLVSETTFVHVLVCSLHPSLSGLITLRVKRG